MKTRYYDIRSVLLFPESVAAESVLRMMSHSDECTKRPMTDLWSLSRIIRLNVGRQRTMIPRSPLRKTRENEADPAILPVVPSVRIPALCKVSHVVWKLRNYLPKKIAAAIIPDTCLTVRSSS